MEILQDISQGRKISLGEYSSHDLAAALKRSFREIPSAITRPENYSALVVAGKVEKVEERLQMIQKCLQTIPEKNKRILKKLLNLLSQLLFYSKTNKMSGADISLIWGPSLIYVRDQDPEFFFVDTNAIASVTETMINYHSFLFQD